MNRCINCGCEIGPDEIYCKDCGDNIFNNYNKIGNSNGTKITDGGFSIINKKYNQSNNKLYVMIGILLFCTVIGIVMIVFKNSKADEKSFDDNLSNYYSEEEKPKSAKITPDVSIENHKASNDNLHSEHNVSNSPASVHIENDNNYNESHINANEGNNKVESDFQNDVNDDINNNSTSYYLGQDVNLRSTPSLAGRSNIICKVYKGETIYDLGETPVRDTDDLGRERNWIKVRTSDGKIGYVSDRAIYMTDKKPYER